MITASKPGGLKPELPQDKTDFDLSGLKLEFPQWWAAQEQIKKQHPQAV